ncbi:MULTISPECIES: hypothetical protein [unclassified Bradyrhizobium]|uniref:hypothetical protein n=1 Tax=unclassified Bradyrhizobium TaxID=2631580 RepID=UPI002478A450|nr:MULTISPECIES: hypothetical protein [unclassified Bradyrhizobium]WGS18964.1 hypothetical protein MTX22_31315 [Bradyrhizobium sp. ISRA463]WGS25798.1 hypothetical protein MTX19_28880 [Bradyrhizobium sp. ISRA464]
MLQLVLFAIRCVDTKEAVGLYWAPDLETLWWMVEAIIDPDDCEYCVVDAPAAITWPGKVPAIGVERGEVDEDIEALSRDVSFEFALSDVVGGEIIKGWIRMPSAPEPEEEYPEILREWKR